MAIIDTTVVVKMVSVNVTILLSFVLGAFPACWTFQVDVHASAVTMTGSELRN